MHIFLYFSLPDCLPVGRGTGRERWESESPADRDGERHRNLSLMQEAVRQGEVWAEAGI